MFTSDAIEHYGSVKAVAEVLAITDRAVRQWGELVPPLSAAKLAKRSGGELTFDPDMYDDWNRKAG